MVDLDERVACPDGNCIGTVENGSCRVCGCAADGAGAPAADVAGAPAADGAGAPAADGAGAPAADGAGAPAADGADAPAAEGSPPSLELQREESAANDSPSNWDDREPCPDGNCTGTVENGACRVCGASA